jgi:uncharacterized peroxidase-related enzyme
MPRIPPLDPARATGAAKTIFDDFQRERGNIPNMFRTLGHIPRILETTFANFRAVMAPGKVPVKVKEMVAVRVSTANRCDYCLASHTMLARKAGVDAAALGALQSGDYSGLQSGERAALAFADEMADGGNHVSDATAENVRREYGDEGLLEIAMVAGLFHYFNRVNNALQIEVTK